MTDQPSHIAVDPADRLAPPNGNPADGNPADRPVAISLPDGSVRQYPAPVTGADVAASIGPGLAKAALAVRVDGELRD
ncbi:MAG: TGS domain-containing protein, partial [Rhodospirillaceae bacterium]|nr:TGS domain-containing protein [Rhodospirillaceae bacterium]